MSEQLALSGFGPEPGTLDQLYFAIFPDGAAAERIARLARRLQREHGLTRRPLETSRFHISLYGLPASRGLRKNQVAVAKAAAEAVRAAAFDISFDRAMSFKGGTLILRPGEGIGALTTFQQFVETMMRRAGLNSPARRQFTPHITLVYDSVIVPEQPIEPISWTVTEFVLVHNLLGQTKHIHLMRYPLIGQNG